MTPILHEFLSKNLLPLAFIGDSVHTLFVREYCLKDANFKMETYHSKSSFYCKASSQAKALKLLNDALTPEEQDIVRRGRNLKPKHHAKNASSADYSFATAFEVLIGYLYLNEDSQRLQEILKLSIELLNKN